MRQHPRIPRLLPAGVRQQVTNIEYDADGLQPEDINCPSAMTIQAENEDKIADAISDQTGWLVKNFCYKPISSFEESPNRKKIHNIVASAILAEPMRHIKREFLLCIRGYMCSTEQDDQLFIRAERAARAAIERTLLSDS